MFLVKKLYFATKWSLHGLYDAYKNEVAFKLELVVAIAAVPAAIFLATNLSELLWLLFPVFFVLVVELMNTAIEAVVDRTGLEPHSLSKRAKDAGSAAVFIAILLAAAVWVLFIVDKYCIPVLD